MLTCEFYGGRLAEVMHTIACLFHIAYIKKVPYNNIVLPLNYVGKDFYGNCENVFIENFPIFSNLQNYFVDTLDTTNYEIRDIASDWGKYYLNKQKINWYCNNNNIIIKNHWLNCIYNTNIYYNLYYNKKLWNLIRNEYNYIFKKTTIAIHIRRCDFVYVEKNKDNFPLLKNRKCLDIKHINNIINNYNKSTENIIIFSDDIKWCHENIKNDNIYYIENNKPYKDLILMSMCDVIVRTRGSTFSKMAMSLKNI